jgi:ABC-type polysaccharide/polyol phosphate export permease
VGAFRQIVLECRMPDSYLIIAGFVAAGIALLVGVGAFLKTQDKFILYI